MTPIPELIERRSRKAAVFSALTGAAAATGFALAAIGSNQTFTAGTAVVGFALLALHNLDCAVSQLRAALKARAEQEKK